MINLIERKESRLAITRIASLLTALEASMRQGTPLDDRSKFLIGQLTRSDSDDTQRNTIEEWLETTKNAYYERLRAAAKDNLSCFAEFMNPEEPPARHHEWLCSELELVASRKIMRLMVSWPPGHGKSTYCSHLFPAWYLGNHPNHRYIQAGHTQDFVDAEFGQRVRGNINSDAYHEVFPEISVDPQSKAASRFGIARHKGRYLGRGVGQGISGFRANIASVDDPFASRADAESPAARKGVFDWFMADFTTRLLPNSPLFIVATRWHTDDLCGRLEEQNNKGLGILWKVLNFPALADDEDDPLEREIGEPLWPDFYDLAFLLGLRATLPSRDWNSLYMGKPMDLVGGAFRAEWVTRYRDFPRNSTNDHGIVTERNVRRIVVSVDSANKTGERNDYTAITVWIEDTQRRHYLVDVIHKKFEFPALCDAIEDTVNKWNKIVPGSRVAALLIEDRGSGTQYIQTHRDTAPAPLIPIEVGTTSKEFRFDGVLPMFEAGEVLLPETAVWLPDYESEILAFPMGKFDDQVDSTSQYLAWARIRRVGGTKKLSGVGVGKATPIPNPSIPGTSRTGMRGSRTFYRGRVRSGDFSGADTHTPSAKIGG